MLWWLEGQSSLIKFPSSAPTPEMASPSGGGQPPSSETPRRVCQIDEAQQQQRQINSRKTPPTERGGYDCEFVERPKELETDCPICLLVLREPFQVTCCGNSFC